MVENFPSIPMLAVKMKIFRFLLSWKLLEIYFIGLLGWLVFAPVQSGGDSLIARDMIRFGPIPIAFAGFWILLLCIKLISYSFLKREPFKIKKLS